MKVDYSLRRPDFAQLDYAATLDALPELVAESSPDLEESEAETLAMTIVNRIEDEERYQAREAVRLLARHFPGFEHALLALWDHCRDTGPGVECDCFSSQEAETPS